MCASAGQLTKNVLKQTFITLNRLNFAHVLNNISGNLNIPTDIINQLHGPDKFQEINS